MNRLFTPFRVGLVVIAGIASFFVLLSFVGRQKYSEKNTYELFATFKDASGLGPKSRVQIAGIEVGVVDHVELTPDARARVVLRIRDGVVLHKDARITKRSASLLGDFLLDIFPGEPGAPALADGDDVEKVVSQPGVEDVFAALAEVTRDIQGVTQSLKTLLASDEVGSIKETIKSLNDISQNLNKTIVRAGIRIDSILGEVEGLAVDVRGMANGQQQNVNETLANIRRFTEEANKVAEQANKIAGTLDKIVGAGEGDLKDSVASLRATLDEIQKTLKGAQVMFENANGAVSDTRSVIARVEKGEGTIGKLVRDDGIAVKLDKTLGEVNTLIAPVAQMQTHVQIREELHMTPAFLGGQAVPLKGKAIVQLKIAPRPDKFYGLEIASEPRGRITRQTAVTTRNPPGSNEVAVQEAQTVVTTDDLKFSAYLGKRLGPAALRVGLIESTGGGGVDLYALSDRLRVTADAFDWANPDARFPRLRLSAQGTLFSHVYLGAGIDDVLNSQVMSQGKPIVGRDLFVTGGIQFNDEDLKSILAIIGLPKPP